MLAGRRGVTWGKKRDTEGLAAIPNSDQYHPTAHCACTLVLLYKACTRGAVYLQGILCIFIVELCDRVFGQ